jgi:hypothetical protein
MKTIYWRHNAPALTLSALALLLLIAFPFDGFTQDTTQTEIIKDTVIIEQEDTVLMKSYATRYDPRKALLFAAAVPGLGQAYNKKYWKLPLVYGGFVAIGWRITVYNNFYKRYRGELFYNLSHGLSANTARHPESQIETSQLRRLVDRSRRERDFWVIMMGAMYVLQIVDAHVDAHLKEFDLNPNLKVSFRPTMDSDAVLGRQTGFSLTMKF